jgi:hypothetical protein
MRRLLVLAMALTTTLTAGGCSDSTSPGNSLSGTYTLRSVNGQPLPATFASPGYSLEVLSGRIDLDAQGNYSGTTTYRETYTGQQPDTYTDTILGYWTLSGNQITLVDTQTGDQYFGTVSGNDITLTDGSITEVFSK